MDKQSYISPEQGKLEISVIRDAQPRVEMALDLGIPNFTVFSLKMPFVDEPRAMSGLVAEAVHAMCDEVSAFMLSLLFEEEVIVQLYATVLAAFKQMVNAKDQQQDAGKDDMVKTFVASFSLPQAFVNETQKKVITAAGKSIDRSPKMRHLELTYSKPSKPTVNDAAKVIRQYRNRSIKQQPKPLYIVVYDQLGRPSGTLPVDQNFKNKLLQMTRKAAVDFSAAISFANEQQMRSTQVTGIPKAISVGGYTYMPEAIAGPDMALYHGPQDWLVKFPDGRAEVFPGRPGIRSLRRLNFPVPLHRFNWTTLPQDAVIPQEHGIGDKVPLRAED
jgi:hypothetical protein